MTSSALRPAPSTPSAAIRVGPVVALLLVSAFVVVLNETAMGVAIPHIMSGFGVVATAAQWLTTAFMLTMAVVIPITGVLLQRYTLRRSFFTAMGLFAVGTVLAAFAPAFGVLLVARIVQALGTSIMLPLLFTTVMQLVAPERRGRTMGLVTIVTAAAPALGPTVSGVIVSSLGWRGVFLVILPIAVIALIAGAVRLRNVTPTMQAGFDVVSVLLSAVGFSGVIYGLASIGDASGVGGEALTWTALTAGVLALAALVVRQIVIRDSGRVLLDVRVFTGRLFTTATLTIAVVSIALFGSLILLPLYLQQVLGQPAYIAGLALLPGGALSGILGPFIGMAYDKVGPRTLVLPGALIITAAMFAFSTLTAGTPLWMVIGMHLLLSVGTALVMTPLMTTALSSVVPSRFSHASAIVNTLQQVAGAAGTAMFITLYTAAGSASPGQDRLAALAHGVDAAFAVGTGISVLAIVLALFLHKPAAPGAAAAAVEVIDAAAVTK